MQNEALEFPSIVENHIKCQKEIELLVAKLKNEEWSNIIEKNKLKKSSIFIIFLKTSNFYLFFFI